MEDLQTCSDLIAKQCAALQRSLAEAEAVAADNPQEVMTKMKAVNERATLFRITSSAMVNVSSSLHPIHLALIIVFKIPIFMSHSCKSGYQQESLNNLLNRNISKKSRNILYQNE